VEPSCLDPTTRNDAALAAHPDGPDGARRRRDIETRRPLLSARHAGRQLRLRGGARGSRGPAVSAWQSGRCVRGLVLGWTEIDSVPERAPDADADAIREWVTNWLQERRGLLAAVRSQVLPEADVVLMNPLHPEAAMCSRLSRAHSASPSASRRRRCSRAMRPGTTLRRSPVPSVARYATTVSARKPGRLDYRQVARLALRRHRRHWRSPVAPARLREARVRLVPIPRALGFAIVSLFEPVPPPQEGRRNDGSNRGCRRPTTSSARRSDPTPWNDGLQGADTRAYIVVLPPNNSQTSILPTRQDAESPQIPAGEICHAELFDLDSGDGSCFFTSAGEYVVALVETGAGPNTVGFLLR
jgi:hypothetical protein